MEQTKAPILTKLLQMSLSEGYFPTALKTSYVIPLHKSGQLSFNAKSSKHWILESLVLGGVGGLFKSWIISEQLGFRPQTCQLLQTCWSTTRNYILTAFEKRHQIESVYLDFSKGFDKLSHLHLLSKLRGNGICGPLWQWM